MLLKQAGLFALCAIVLLIALAVMESEDKPGEIHSSADAVLRGFYLAPAATALGGFVDVARLSEQSDARWQGIEE